MVETGDRTSPNPTTALNQHRFVVLLGGLTLLLLAGPLLSFSQVRLNLLLMKSVSLVVFLVMLLTAVFAVSATRRDTIITVGLFVLVSIVSVLELTTGDERIELAGDALGILAVGFVILVLLKHLFAARQVTIDTIASSLCVYILLGLLWAMAYSVLQILDPLSFNVPASDAGGPAMRFEKGRSTVSLYYSFVTQTTLGYGDITPVTPPARMLSTLQAIVGQIYLTVLVARLVGMNIAQFSKQDR